MSTETTNKELLRGGQFLVKETLSEDVFTPEDFSEEQKMMKDSVKEFVDREIWPKKEEFEKKELCAYRRDYAQSWRTWLSRYLRSRRV